MKIPLTKILLVSLATLIFLTTPLAAAKSQVRFDELQEISAGPKELLMPGRAEGSGTSFAIKDSEYLNINLKSEKEIKIVLESIPRMISINIEASATTASTSLTLEGLEPNKTYYQYQDSYKNEAVFISNSNGSFSWGQDLTQPHHIWLQEIKSTVFLPEDCSKYGIWDGTTSTCTLTQDLTESVEITENNITLDCNGHSITGQLSGYGIYLNNKSGINIKNCGIFHFTTGISLLSSFSNNLLNNTISNNGWYGIYVGWSNTNTISNNTLSNNNNGIVFYQSDNNDVVDNTLFDNFVGIFSGYSGDNPNNNNLLARNVIFNNHYGLLIEFSTKNTLTQNKMFNNRFNFFLNGIFDSHFDHDIDLSNTTDGKPIYYLKNIENKIYDSSTNAGIFYCVSCNNVTLKDLTLTKNGLGILFWKTQNSKIENNIISDNWFHGIYLGFSDSNLITKNTLSNNTQGGSSSLGFKGEYFTISSSGIHFRHSSDNTFTLNNLLKEGLWLLESSNNQSYHNNFRERLFAIIAGGSNNLFDDDYPSGGNYWSDYVGVDEKSGGNQDQPGLDGIGDTPYTFYGGQDRYPFMKENGWGEPPPPEEPEKWSFAIITDLHIGRGYLDYGGEGYDDYAKPWLGKEEIAGQSYYLTERLKKVVKWINENNRMDNIKFAVVLGDITDSGEYSEFKKVKEILDGLEIPYFPLIGNHDVWSWYVRQDGNSRVYKFPEIPVGDIYFNMIFDEVFFEQQFKNLGATWHERDGDPLLQNYAFSYGGINFIALDFIQRDPGALKTYKPVVYDITKNFLKNWLEIPPAGNSSVLLSHHPLASIKKGGVDASFEDDDLNSLEREIAGWEKVMANFAGHIHGLYDERYPITPGVNINPFFMNANINYKDEGHVTPGGIPVVTTEILPVASNEQDLKGIVRIVEIEGSDRASNYDLIKGEFRALNPYFKEIEWSPRFAGFPPRKVWKVEFELYAFTKLYPFSYIVNHGDGSEESGEVPRWWWIPPYWRNTIELDHKYPKEGGTYKIEFRAKKPVLSVEEKTTRDITLPRWSWGYFLSSPADIVLTDPSGLKISKQISEIPGAFYFETDFDEDGDLDDVITLPERKIGDYTLALLPESDAKATDTYSLGVLTEDERIISLAQNVQISNIPSQPYIVRSTETEIIPLIPVTVDFDPDTLNLKSKGQWVTVYIELPIGHGYEVNMIDLASVMLNGQIRTEAKPTGIGDYDSDGTPDLMVKFNRVAVQSILQVGEKIKITITGKLIDGRLFEGIDLVRVISP